MEILIVGVHQTYVNAYAGGYIRLREFLKRIPLGLDYKIIDVYPSIYTDIVEKGKIISFSNPKIIEFLLTKAFPVGVLCERIWMSFSIYRIARKNIREKNFLIYVPMAELLHLYLPAVLLKIQSPKLKLLVDILNFEFIEFNLFKLTKKLTGSPNLIISLGVELVHLVTFSVLKNTIKNADYVFTVSIELVNEIKKIYPKKSIDFTPSGVSIKHMTTISKQKKYMGVYVGRITEQKGIHTLLAVWKKMITHIPDAKLAIVGLAGSEMIKSIKEKIKIYHLENNVDLYFSVEEQKKVEIISRSEIFLHLANYEPLFPVIGILEGLASGLPSIVFDMPTVKSEVRKIKDNNFIFVAENGNIDKVVDMVIDHSQMSKKAKETINIAARNYASKFDWGEISKKEFKIIEKLANTLR